MISVIIPVYNVEQVVRYSIESVLRQKGCDCEIILVDDGSTDGSGSICDSYAHLPDVKVIHKANGGLSSARNAGIDVAQGDYLLFLDSDDYLRPGALKLLGALAIELPQVDFIQYHYEEVKDYADCTKSAKPENLVIVSDKREMFTRMLDLGGIGASACTKLISAKALSHTRFTEGIIQEDEDFTIRLIDSARTVAYIDNPLYMYVWRDGSIITQKYTSKRLDIIPILKRQIDILNRNGFDDLAARVQKKLFTSLCLYYVQARKTNLRKDANTIKAEIKLLAPFVGNWNGDKFAKIAAAINMSLPALQLYYIYKKTIDNGKDS